MSSSMSMLDPQTLSLSTLRRISMFGPLDIASYNDYLRGALQYYKLRTRFPFPYTLKLDNFLPRYFLGAGAFGKVILVKYKVFSKSYYAMKIIKKKALIEQNIVEFALSEKRILQGLNHPFCIRLEYFTSDRANLYYLLPYLAGGDLFGYLKKKRRFSEHLTKFYVAQIVLALEYIHLCRTVHRDLKPDNMILDHFGYLRIADFGFAKELKKSLRTYTFCGTPDYIAPEVVQGRPYSFAVDWWALGVIAYEMVCGEAPFTDENTLVLYRKIVNAHYRVPSGFTPKLANFVSQLLEVDVTKRLGNLKEGAQDIKDHEWLENVDWLAIFNRRVIPPHIPDVSWQLETGNFPHLKKLEESFSIVPEDPDDDDNYDEYFKDF